VRKRSSVSDAVTREGRRPAARDLAPVEARDVRSREAGGASNEAIGVVGHLRGGASRHHVRQRQADGRGAAAGCVTEDGDGLVAGQVRVGVKRPGIGSGLLEATAGSRQASDGREVAVEGLVDAGVVMVAASNRRAFLGPALVGRLQ